MLHLSAIEILRIRNAVHEKQIFLVADQTIPSGIQYLNILAGSQETPHVSYSYDFQPAPNSNSTAQAVDDTVRFLGINRNYSCLLLSDAAIYVAAAGAILKSLNPKQFHVTFVARFLHNCAMKVKFHFEDVDQLIAKVKLTTVKTKSNKPNLLPLVAHLSLLIQDAEAG